MEFYPQDIKDMQKTWFVSDIHLDSRQPEIVNQFKALLNSCDSTVDDLYLLGDIFEIWVGDDDNSPLHQEIIKNLQNVAQRGTRLHFLPGNRDFLIGEAFLKSANCSRLPDEACIDVYGTPVLVMHGDTLCTQDTQYLRFREFAHSRWIQKLFLMLPLSWRMKIAEKARDASTKHTSQTKASYMDVTQAEVQRIMQKHQVNYLIHGHTHLPNTHRFTADGNDKTRIVLPAWHQVGRVLEWRADNSFSMQDIRY